jgi:hypothetical protein
MANFKELYDLHKSKNRSKLSSGDSNAHLFVNGKKYSREKIINAKYFNETEREFLDWLLIKDEYTIDEVKSLVRREIERMVD